jgi:hypothetical protein
MNNEEDEQANKDDEAERETEIEDIDLVANLDECHETCVEGMIHSLSEGGDFAKLEHIRWLLDCAEICQFAGNFVIRHSEYAGDILSICAFICEDCAQSCETFFEDEHMKNCAEVCRNCAAVCREAIDETEETEGEEEE